MNLAQMRSAVRDKLMGGGGMNTVIANDSFWSNNEINHLLNDAYQNVAQAIRRARKDYFTRIVNTTDSALTIFGQTFNPSSLAWVAGTGNYTLPPDFLQLLSITDLTASSALDVLKITMMSIEHEPMRSLMNQTASGDLVQNYYGAIIGKGTLMIRPYPNGSRDFQYIYVRSLPKLRDWALGSATVNPLDSVINFTASADCTHRMVAGDEIVLSATTTAPIADPTAEYPVVSAINSATQVQLAGPALLDGGATLTNVAYICSSVPEFPSDYHDLLVNYALREAFKKGPNPNADSSKLFGETFAQQMTSLIAEVEIRQGMDQEFTTPFLDQEVW